MFYLFKITSTSGRSSKFEILFQSQIMNKLVFVAFFFIPLELYTLQQQKYTLQQSSPSHTSIYLKSLTTLFVDKNHITIPIFLRANYITIFNQQSTENTITNQLKQKNQPKNNH